MSLNNSVLDQLHRSLVAQLEGAGINPNQLSKTDLEERIKRLVLAAKVAQTDVETLDLAQRLMWQLSGFGMLEPSLQDPSITEIMVNGPEDIFVERAGQLTRIEAKFGSVEELKQLIVRIASMAGRRIDEAQPFVDARLPDGSRVNAVIPPLSRKFPVLTIRKFPAETLTLQQLEECGTLSKNMAAFLRAAILSKQNLLISGSTGSGKTSTLNALAALVPGSERLIIIEDTLEMRFAHPHLVQLEARQPNIEGTGEVTIRTLLKNSLRMRPDRIIIGEVRGGEALDMLQAMNTGHQGSFTTIHANAPLEALSRLETMALMTDVELPLVAIHEQVAMAINFVVHQERMSDGFRKVVAISEVVRVLGPALPYEVRPLFVYNKITKNFENIGKMPMRARAFEENGIKLDPKWFSS